MRFRGLIFVTIVPALLAACSTEADSGGTASAQRVEPHGGDSPGSILIKEPGDAPVVAATYWIDANNKVDVGTPLTNLSVGSKVVQMHAYDWWLDAVRVSVSAGQTTTVTTGLLGIANTGGPRTLGLGADPGNEFTLTLDGKGVPPAFADGASRVPLFEGRHFVSWGLLDGVTVDVAAGETKVLNVNDVSTRKIVRAKTTKGDFPTACNGRNQWRIFVNDPHLPYGVVVPQRAWDGNEMDFGISGVQPDDKRYVLYNDIWTESDPHSAPGVPFPLAQRGAGPLAWTIGVVDVDDVLVDQKQPRVAGTWAVFKADGAGNRLNNDNFIKCTAPTGTGAPLPPGHYRLEVYYNTVEAGQKTDVHIIDI